MDPLSIAALSQVTPAAAGPGALEWIKAAGPVLGALGGGAASPTTSQARGESSSTGVLTGSFDSSGWTVNTGSGSASASRGFELNTWAILGALALGAIWLVRR